MGAKEKVSCSDGLELPNPSTGAELPAYDSKGRESSLRTYRSEGFADDFADDEEGDGPVVTRWFCTGGDFMPQGT